MNKSLKQYYFEDVLLCEMCQENTSMHKILGQRLNKSQGLNPRMKEGITVSVKKCNKCSLIYSSPQPIPFDIQNHYGVPPETYWKEHYFRWNAGYFSYEISKFKELTVFQPGMRHWILERASEKQCFL